MTLQTSLSRCGRLGSLETPSKTHNPTHAHTFFTWNYDMGKSIRLVKRREELTLRAPQGMHVKWWGKTEEQRLNIFLCTFHRGRNILSSRQNISMGYRSWQYIRKRFQMRLWKPSTLEKVRQMRSAFDCRLARQPPRSYGNSKCQFCNWRLY